MIDRPDIEAIRRRADAASPAPWAWRGNVDGKHFRLAAKVRRGEATVMDFVRYGMQGAAPRFNVSNLMDRADTLAVFAVCPEAKDRSDPRVYRGDILGFRHPDAEFIAHARQDIEDLLAYIAHLEAQVPT